MNNQVIPYLLVSIFSIAFPLSLLIWWKVKTHTKLSIFIVGGLCFAIFAFGLEQILHYFCLININPISQFITGNLVAYALYGGLAAGIFEETGRLFAYKVLLKKHTNKETAIAYGIGHGGMEVVLILGLTYITYTLVLSGVKLADENTLATLKQTIDAIPSNMMAVACFERISACLIHIGLSMVVFYGVRKHNLLWYFIAIILHALVDIPAVFYQTGLISIWIVEVFTLALGIFALLFGRKLLNRLPE